MNIPVSRSSKWDPIPPVPSTAPTIAQRIAVLEASITAILDTRKTTITQRDLAREASYATWWQLIKLSVIDRDGTILIDHDIDRTELTARITTMQAAGRLFLPLGNDEATQ